MVDERLVRPSHESLSSSNAEALCLSLGRFCFERNPDESGHERVQAWCTLVLGNPAANGDEICRLGIMRSFRDTGLFKGAEERTITIV